MAPSSQELGLLRRISEPRSIREKLLLLYALVLGGISLSIFAYFPARIAEQAEAGMREKSAALGLLASASLESALVFDDREAMQSVLRGFGATSDVVYAEIVVDGGVVAAWSRGDTVDSAGTALLVSETRISFRGEPIGVLQIRSSVDELRAAVRRERGDVALISLLIFIAGGLAVAFISDHVSRPLRRILKTADRIAGGETTRRAPVETADEVGQMAASFNRMVDRLEATSAELEASHDQLTQIMDNLPAEVALFDVDGRYCYVNPSGISREEHREWVIGKTPTEYCRYRGVDPAYGLEAEGKMEDCLREGRTVRFEQLLMLPGDQTRHFIRLIVPIAAGNAGVARLLGYGVDVTDQMAAERALRESEERLLQAQRMESIGQLAGGVAHDFNNLLTAITGHSELLLLDLAPDSPLYEDASEIRDAADRAASLTKQLLAFSRKQVMQTQVIEVNERIQKIEKMLRRLIGEDIELEIHLEAVDHVDVDPAKLDQVVLNLAVNARDAMPDGGLLRIATEATDVRGNADLASGRYVRLLVSDTGTGMDETTLQHIFEPFFTTKEIGKGTGLGLSTVYGIIKQSGGSVTCYSEEGVGTTFKVYLPSAESPPSADDAEESERELTGGPETILLTEDQDNVRKLAATVLSRLGYNVLVADGPEEALAIAEGHEGRLDLLLTDIVMPGMNGLEVAERITAIRPGTAVIFMSGYTDDALDRHGVKPTATNYLEKPFTPETLAQIVRARLDMEVVVAPEPSTVRTA